MDKDLRNTIAEISYWLGAISFSAGLGSYTETQFGFMAFGLFALYACRHHRVACRRLNIE